MSPIDPLAAAVGGWAGTNVLQDPNTETSEESPSTALIAPVLGGRFVRIDYTWAHRGRQQEGSLLVGFDPTVDEVSAHWIDTWHMGRRAMNCVGAASDGGTIVLVGSYAAPPGPDWGWRIEIAAAPEALRIAHANIDPDGREYPAAEGVYFRA